MTSHLDPLRFEPILKRLLWGGRRLGTLLGKDLGPHDDYAECWELADHGADVSRVSEGPLAGTSLRELLEQAPIALLGPELAAAFADQFPLMIKFLDAHQVLSVQVHPDDDLGQKLVGDNGKTESWLILHADPGSLIYAGLRPGTTREAFAAALADGTVEAHLHRFEPRAGDCVLVPAGTVHAIGAGIVLAEVQQMSDATFRVFDWGRVGPDGRPRELHVEHAMAAIDFTRGPVDPVEPIARETPGGTVEALARCPYFALERLTLSGPDRVGRPDRFTVLLGLEGEAVIVSEGHEYPISTGQTLLLPASIGPCEVRPLPHVRLLSCIVPPINDEG
jgi:mannose-6-phosphate isomerase